LSAKIGPHVPVVLHLAICDLISQQPPYPADLTQDGDVDQLARDAEREFGRLDILIHSAGTIERGAIADSPTEKLDTQLRSNVGLPYLVTHRLLPLLRKRPGRV
jgi:NAD(P)-dependent dehydrogenase (short-subunit alcohol dehydrogenase family)